MAVQTYIPVILLVIAFLCGGIAASEFLVRRLMEHDDRRPLDRGPGNLDRDQAS